MEVESDNSSFENFEDEGMAGEEAMQGEVKDMHYDEVYEVNESDEEDVPSNPEEMPGEMEGESNSEFSHNSEDMMMNPKAFQQPQYSGQFQEQEVQEEDPIFQGAYNAAEYSGLQVSSEIKELFQYIQRYKPQHLELETKLRPFIPDYIPAAGEVDAFLKIPKPDGREEELGLTVLDEPKLNQSDPALLEPHLRPLLKAPGTAGATAVVRSIENADKNPKQITRWIQTIAEVHRNKPPPHVSYSNAMPDIDTLMDVWPTDVEELLSSIELPGPDLDVDLQTYARLVCAILDIPIHNLGNNKGLVESLHLLFTLYSDFKNSQHFNQNVMSFQ